MSTHHLIEVLVANDYVLFGHGNVPTRNHEVFAWCLANGLLGVHPMTLMTIGLYNEPAAAWMPTVSY